MKRVPVWVPTGTLALAIDGGSGVVSFDPGAEAERVLVYYEGNRFGAVNIVTYADRVRQAYGRLRTSYPTVAQSYVRRDQLIQVGWFEPELGKGEVDLNDPVTLAIWLGVDTIDVDDDELVCT